jgi:hypothetical protein
MSNSATTLQNIIRQSFDGKKSALAKAAGVAPRVITRLTQDQSFTPETLRIIASALLPSDARTLALAACRDLLPPELADEVSLDQSSILAEHSPIYNLTPVDDKSEEILAKLRTLIARDPETRDWLHHLAEWIFPE